MFLRRLRLVISVLAVAASAWAGEQAARPITLQFQWYPQAQFAGYVMAKEKGFFREAGLPDVRVEWWTEGKGPLDRMLDGETDFCTAWLSQTVVSRSQGKPLVNIAQITQKSALMLVSRRGSGISSPEDMDGRRVGLWGVDFTAQPHAFFRWHHIEPQIVLQSYSVTPFLRGAVDVASAMYYNEYHQLLEAGLRPEDLRTFLFADHGMNFPEDGMYCTERTRRERPDVCEAMAASCMRGWAYAISHEREAVRVIMQYCEDAQMPTNHNHQRWMLRAMAELIQYRVGPDPQHWGSLHPDAYHLVAKVLKEQGLIANIPPYQDFYQPALAAKEGGQ